MLAQQTIPDWVTTVRELGSFGVLCAVLWWVLKRLNGKLDRLAAAVEKATSTIAIAGSETASRHEQAAERHLEAADRFERSVDRLANQVAFSDLATAKVGVVRASPEGRPSRMSEKEENVR